MSDPAVAQPAATTVEPTAAPPAPTPAQLPSEAPETDFSAFVAEMEADPAEPAAAEVPPVQEPTSAPGTPAPVVDKGAAPPTQTVTAPAPSPLSVEPKAETPPVAPAPSAAAAAVEPTSPPAAPQVPAEKVLTAEELKTKRAELVDAFSSCYKLTDEDTALLQTEPNKVLPKLAGSIAADVFEATARLIFGQLPAVIQSHLAGVDAAKQARETFFKAFPALDKPEYIPVIGQVTEMYRRMNPRAPYDANAIQTIGKHASYMLGLTAPAGTSPAAPSPAPPPRPAAPLTPGASAPSRPAQTGGNLFDELARFEFVDE